MKKENYLYKDILEIDLISEFKERNIKRDVVYYSREDRNKVASGFISDYNNKTNLSNILNIGSGGVRNLNKFVDESIKIFDIDIAGDCDLKVNLDKIDSLPFEDNSFEICFALDVLEHLEHFHLILDEICRVTSEEVIISLPNSAFEIVKNVINNGVQKRPDINRGVYSKFYGLPLEVPYDRHRWYMYFQDIIRFFVYFEKVNKYEINFYVPNENSFFSKLIKLFSDRLYYTFYCPYIFIKISKKT